MKRLRILLTLLFVALLLLPTALAAVDGNFEYQELDDGTVILTNYKGGERDLALPEELGGKTVSTLSTDAFSRCSELRSITIPLSIVEIIENPFRPWDGSNPFLCCESLEAIHVSPDHPTLAEIDGVLFRKAEKQLLSYPAAKEGASYDVPQGIAAIQDKAFSGNDKLRSVSLPDSVLTVGRNPFYDCRHLLEITVAEGNPALSAVDGVLFRTEDRHLVSYPAGLKKADYAVPDGTASIGERAFYQCDALESVVLPDSVTEIGEEAFNFCTSLKNLKMSDGVTKIGGSAFQHCESLGEATLPDGLEHIGRVRLQLLFVAEKHRHSKQRDGNRRSRVRPQCASEERGPRRRSGLRRPVHVLRLPRAGERRSPGQRLGHRDKGVLTPAAT